MPRIELLTAREILDSRGRPTVLAKCILEGGLSASASVPSGASTGAAEAVELRDRDMHRYRGLGCRNAVGNITGEINTALSGRIFETQAALDDALVALDGTPNKCRLGANAILAVSIAFARATALAQSTELWKYFAEIAGTSPHAISRLTINLFSGGIHAGKQVAIQDVLLVPASASTIDESLAVSWEIYQIAAEICLKRFGMRLLRADEGGMAPPFESAEEMIEIALEAIASAGYKPGTDVALAIDVASSHFYSRSGYRLGEESLSSSGMIELLNSWVSRYPIVSVEDGLADDDWAAWPHLLRAIGDRALVVGDDLLCTNPLRIQRAIDASACNALLLKVNQVGTLTEAAKSLKLACSAGWQVTLSVRSGETEDTWAADLAVGWAADQFKNGSVTQSERLAKYNRLLEIEAQTAFPIAVWPNSI